MKETAHRRITIYCSAESHPTPPDLCALIGRPLGDMELWSPDGRADIQRLAPADSEYARSMVDTYIAESPVEQFAFDLADNLQRPTPFALRFNIRCDCGDAITIGDLLAKGYASTINERHELANARGGSAVVDGRAARQVENHRRLSQLADSGVSRLTITGLRRTLTL